MKTTEEQVVVKEELSTTKEKLWEAITRLDKMKEWYFDNIDNFIAESGSKSRFPVYSEERKFTHLWEVTEVVPFQKIVYNWKYEEYAGDSFVSFELHEKENSTELTLRVEVVEDFQDDIPEFKRESCEGGWKYFINGRLKDYLDSK